MADNALFAERSAVVQLGSAVLDLVAVDPVKAVETLEQYVEALASWQVALTAHLQNGCELASDERELVVAIAEQHAQILAAASELKGDTEESMQNLHKWVKGIRGYADTLLPRRISTIKPKQG
jgi:hypothetical protein